MKRSFSLVELFVAAILASVLVGVLFTAMRRQVIGTRQFEVVRNETLARAHVQLRLGQVLAEAKTPPRMGEGTLDVTFDNGVDADPNYCHHISAHVEVSRGGELVLETGPGPRREVLLTGVKKARFEQAPDMVLLSVMRGGRQVDFALPLSP